MSRSAGHKLVAPRRRAIAAAAAALLTAQAALLGWMAYRDSATWDEVGHLAAALEHWSEGTFDLYAVNPPLVRLAAGAPVRALIGAGAFDEARRTAPGRPQRPEFSIGPQLAREYGPRYFRLMTAARWACIPFALLGGWVCFLWARELYGPAAGLLALALWTFSPSVLAYGHLITPDAAAASLGVGAAYAFRNWLRAPGWPAALWAGAALGLAELTKTTWVVLFPLWPALWLAYGLRPGPAQGWRRRGRAALQLAAMLLLALWVLNLGYGFERSFVRLGDYAFQSRALAGPTPTAAVLAPGETYVPNRFAGTWLAGLPVPVPQSYLLGIDHIKWEYERGYWSYLNGQWRLGGWWYYYLYAMLVKEPLGTWLLALLALALTVARPRLYAAPWREELLLLLPAAVVIALVSSQTGFNHHLRYVLPAFPFLFIWISKVARSIQLRRQWVSAIAGVALAWSVASSLSAFPHSMSYFNELAGGPRGGHWHLGNSNTDWGQDLLYLKDWYDHHPEARPLHVGYDLPLIDPRLAGVEWRSVPAGPVAPNAAAAGVVPADSRKRGPLPGWYAVSVNWLHDRDRRYDYFLDLEPVDRVGYTMRVYHVTPDEANRLRRRYGLPDVPPPDGGTDQ